MTMQTLESKDSITVCPCVNCICVAVCRHKTYLELFSCALLTGWYAEHESYPIYRYIVKNLLKPTRWNVNSKGSFSQLETRELW